ncbi:amidase [Kribbella lupini]|uniref:Amidase n=1 Tax=Kribbella lupini TaxID=291602 RepID=A0ABP4NG91_9ACTN
MTSLHYLSATEALHLFRTRQLSPVELMQAIVDRASIVEPVVNAFAEQMFEQALLAARAAEQRYRSGGEPGPLEGLPVAAKEEQHLAGFPVTDGTLLRPSYPAPQTALVLARIQEAGGIVHARTTTSEFCCLPMSHSRRWGVTRNPWNLETSVGGSSGGSAASLAAATTTLATGSDIGGSLRAPASFAGVVGYKPPHGRNPILPPAGLDPYFHHGPMAKTVADCALLQNVMAGEDPRDPDSHLASVAIPRDLEGVRGLTVAVSPAPGDFPVDPEIRANTEAVADALRSAGAVVAEIELGLQLDMIKRALGAHFGSALGTEILELDRLHPDVVTPYCLAFARDGVKVGSMMDTASGRALEQAVRDQLDEVFSQFDALIIPTVGATAFAAGEDYTETSLAVNGVALEHFSDASLTPAFNISSTHPVISVPSGWAHNNVPTGVQVVAARYADVTAFRVASAIEQTVGAGFITRTPQDENLRSTAAGSTPLRARS